jgi:phosphoribosyl 1,2-cyclic phosphodiesterase
MGGQKKGGNMIVRFWGVRGSVPTPMGAQQLKEKIMWALKGASDRDIMDERAVEHYVEGLPRHMKETYGGNTSCVELHSEDTTIIFDAGSGIRLLGLHLMDGRFGQGAGTAHLFLSHTHWDHIQGFPFFLPAHIPGNRIIIYSPHPDVKKRFSMQQNPSYFPVPLKTFQADIEFVSLSEGQNVAIGHVDVTNIKLNHPGESFGYRVRKQDASFVYATDTEFTNLSKSDMEKYIGFFSRAKVLVFDSQYTLRDALEKEDWGHSSSLTGADMAHDAGVETLVLFHHEPTYDDNTLRDILQRTRKYAELQESDHTCKVIMAYEGLELVV